MRSLKDKKMIMGPRPQKEDIGTSFYYHKDVKEAVLQDENDFFELIGSLNGLFVEEFIKCIPQTKQKRINQLLIEYQDKKLKNFGDWGNV